MLLGKLVFFELEISGQNVPDHEMDPEHGSCGYGFAFLATSQSLLDSRCI